MHTQTRNIWESKVLQALLDLLGSPRRDFRSCCGDDSSSEIAPRFGHRLPSWTIPGWVKMSVCLFLAFASRIYLMQVMTLVFPGSVSGLQRSSWGSNGGLRTHLEHNPCRRCGMRVLCHWLWAERRNLSHWENQHHSLIMSTWDVLRDTAKDANMLLTITEPCSNPEFPQE